MKRYAPEQMELATRSTVSLAIGQEIQEGPGGRRLCPPGFTAPRPQPHSRTAPADSRVALEFAGIDPIETPIPIRPGAHYQMGGVKANSWGETDLPGCSPQANVPASACMGPTVWRQSHLETIVFGRRVGTRAAEIDPHGALQSIPETILRHEEQRLKALLAKSQVRSEPGRSATISARP